MKEICNKIPTKRFELLVDKYMDDNFDRFEKDEILAQKLQDQFGTKAIYRYSFDTYLYMVDLWKRGWFKKRYDIKAQNSREWEYIEMKEILKNIKESLGYEKTKK